MSNLLYLDESNGNGIYATKQHNNCATTDNNAITAAATANANSLNSIMTATTNAAAAAVANANATITTAQIHTSVSNEDLSQSLSEYTDADESISAPTEFLAEFLSAVMLKDYKKALKYCKLILQYEPNNATAKEFYPLILEKLRVTTSSDSDENYNKSSSSPEILLDMQASDPSAGESDGGTSDDQLQAIDEQVDDYGAPEDNSSREPNSNESHMVSSSSESSSSCGSAGISLSESVDEVDDDDDEVDNDMSSSGDDLPNDEHMCGSASDEAADDNGGGGGAGLGANACGFAGNRVRGVVPGNESRNSSSGGENRSRSDNTTHSYSSLLLEEEDDIVPASLQFAKDLQAHDLDISNGNKIPSASCSDSESPTEPLTQRLAAILRSKCSVSTGD